jgi:SHS2 domain-containing protein
MPTVAGYELLEHTADLGIGAWAPTAPEALEHAARALAEIMGVALPGPGTRRTVQVSATDEPGVLVAFLNELIWLHEAESVGFAEIDVIAASDQDLIAEVETVTLQEAPGGLGVKAATYHQLEVGRRGGTGVEVRVFLDV